MNNRQIEMIKRSGMMEREVIVSITRSYMASKKEIQERIMKLESKDMTESILNRIKYQKQLETQVTDTLTKLNNTAYVDIDKYIKDAYTDGFIGTMYDLHGQGIPLILPVNQQDLLNAVINDTKLSKNLYETMGHDMTDLIRGVNQEVARGVAMSSSFIDMARNIDKKFNISQSNALRIARTEGHRVRMESTHDGQKIAKDNGADIVKQWDATQDARTRRNHRELDGQIQNIDDPFVVPSTGATASYPSGFGVAKEDINCRCALLQRARWALDEDELKVLQERAEFYGLDKTKDFDDFKKKYLKGVEAEVVKVKPILDARNFPASFHKTKAGTKQTEMFVDHINKIDGTDPEMLEIYNNFDNVESIQKNGIPFDVKYGKSGHSVGYRTRYSGALVETTLKIPKLDANNMIGAVHTTGHELGHLMDMYLRSDVTKADGWISINDEFKGFLKGVKNTIRTNGPSDKIKNFFQMLKVDYNDAKLLARDKYDLDMKDLNLMFSEVKKDPYKDIAEYNKYLKLKKKVATEYADNADIYRRNVGGGGNAVEDMYDALSGGSFRDNGTIVYGHGSTYYTSVDSRIHELWANYSVLSITRPDLIDMIREDQPELIEMLDAVKKQVLERVRK